jgi:peptide methionine sulfoxide reductase msrA/msrB
VKVFMTTMLALGMLLAVMAGGVPGPAAVESEDGKMTGKHSEALERATFAGGCFWCTEADFEKEDGVVEVISGYTGGHTENPTYEEVCSGRTGHLEAVQVVYDPEQVSYEALLDLFWRHVNPTDPGGQFVDRGSQYRTAIFTHNEAQRRLAEKSKEELHRSGRFQGPIVTEILPLERFYVAEDYHQGFHQRCPMRYKTYRMHSGRDAFIKEVWGDEKRTDPSPPA